MTILLIDTDRQVALVQSDGATIEVSYTPIPGIEPIEVVRRQIDPSYRWLSFRRALLAAPEYPIAVALAIASPALSLADSKLTSAIDACLNQGAEPEEIAAFQSALALYLSQLPDSPEGAAISSAIQSLCAEYLIPTTG